MCTVGSRSTLTEKKTSTGKTSKQSTWTTSPGISTHDRLVVLSYWAPCFLLMFNAHTRSGEAGGFPTSTLTQTDSRSLKFGNLYWPTGHHQANRIHKRVHCSAQAQMSGRVSSIKTMPTKSITNNSLWWLQCSSVKVNNNLTTKHCFMRVWRVLHWITKCLIMYCTTIEEVAGLGPTGAGFHCWALDQEPWVS